jgi:flagellin-like hook-associated protein FlgL
MDQSYAWCRQDLLDQTDALLQRIEKTQRLSHDIQNDIALLRTAENALDFLSGNYAILRQLVIQKNQAALSKSQAWELDDRISNLITVNTLVAEDTEYNGRYLFKDDVIQLNGYGGDCLYFATVGLPEISGLETRDIQSTLDSLNGIARIIERQYNRITTLLSMLLSYDEHLKKEFILLMKARDKMQVDS